MFCAPAFAPNLRQEHIMQKNRVLKQLLAVSAVAAMFGASGVHAQTDKGMETQTPVTTDQSGSTSTGATAAGQTSAASAAAKLSKADQRIVMDMARANMAEIEAGKLALSKSQNDEVKKFAQQMIDDHGTALTEVQALAQARNVTLPTELDKKHKAMAAKLEKMSDTGFDRAYMAQAGVSDHKQVLSMLKKYRVSAKDPEVKGLAEKMLPVVEQHLKSAQQMSTAKNGTTHGK
jgi:putative membrane protein